MTLCSACAGFPTRKAIRPFAQRYKLLLRGAAAGAVVADMNDEVPFDSVGSGDQGVGRGFIPSNSAFSAAFPGRFRACLCGTLLAAPCCRTHQRRCLQEATELCVRTIGCAAGFNTVPPACSAAVRWTRNVARHAPQEAGEVCREVLTLSGLSGWQIGKTRAFLRAGQLAALEVHGHASSRYRQLLCSVLAISPVNSGPGRRPFLPAAAA